MLKGGSTIFQRPTLIIIAHSQGTAQFKSLSSFLWRQSVSLAWRLGHISEISQCVLAVFSSITTALPLVKL